MEVAQLRLARHATLPQAAGAREGGSRRSKTWKLGVEMGVPRVTSLRLFTVKRHLHTSGTDRVPIACRLSITCKKRHRASTQLCPREATNYEQCASIIKPLVCTQMRLSTLHSHDNRRAIYTFSCLVYCDTLQQASSSLCDASPSKNRPQPPMNRVSPENTNGAKPASSDVEVTKNNRCPLVWHGVCSARIVSEPSEYSSWSLRARVI